MSSDKKGSGKKRLFQDIFGNEHPAGPFEIRNQKLSAQEIQKETEKLADAIRQDKTVPVRMKNNRVSYFMAAAVSLLVVTTGIYFFIQGRQHLSEYQTGYGETRQIMLPDSSIIKLNANSTLAFHANWDQQSMREVWLSGEAFFVVTKKLNARNTRFVVHTNDLDVEVLGTRFNVQNRHDKTKVVLSSGKVKLNIGQNEQEVLMEPGEMVAYSLKTQSYEKKQVEPQKYTSWKDNLLTFDNSTLAEIAAVLKDSYGISFIFEDADIAKNRFTTTVPSQKIDVLYPMLEESFNLKITNKGGQIIMRKKP